MNYQLEVGDTFDFGLGFFNKVESVKNIDGIKSIYFEFNEFVIFVEGKGSTWYGIVPRFMGFQFDTIIDTLNIYDLTDIDENPRLKFGFEIYSNPAINMVTVVLKEFLNVVNCGGSGNTDEIGDFLETVRCSIVDVTGKIRVEEM